MYFSLTPFASQSWREAEEINMKNGFIQHKRLYFVNILWLFVANKVEKANSYEPMFN